MLDRQTALPQNKFVESEVKMVKFLGAILSYSAISTNPVPLELHPTFWKLLLEGHLDANEQELFAIDAYQMQNLNKIREWASTKTDEEFDMLVESIE